MNTKPELYNERHAGWLLFPDWAKARGLTAYRIAADLSASQSAVGKWCKGGVPSYRMRSKLQTQYDVISSIDLRGRWIVKDKTVKP